MNTHESEAKSATQSKSTTHTRTEKRYWLRKNEPQIGWWPWGLLPLLGLIFLYLYGALGTAPIIEADVEKTVSSQLSKQSVNLRSVVADGQEVTVTAISNAVDQNAEISRIKFLAKTTECDTWVGLKNCPTDVTVKLEKPATEMAQSKKAQAVKVLPALAAARFHDFMFSQSGDSITLNGEVPDDKVRAELLSLASAKYTTVVDQLRLSKANAKPAYSFAYARALKVLKSLETGTANRVNGVLSISGVVTEENEKLVRDLFTDKINTPTLGTLSLSVQKAVNTCNTEFKSLLNSSTINFRTGSADIDTDSKGLLESLATLVNQCPGSLVVEGHTDNIGNASFNEKLSQRRANAGRDSLVAFGVKANRLQAKGYGMNKPVADNSTATGRAKNRRIVIRIAQ